MNTYKIINGNCIEEMKKMPSSSVDLIFADPPYWMRVSGVLQRVEGGDFDGCDDKWDNQFNTLEDYKKFTFDWLRECYRVLSENGSIWVIGSMQCIYTIGNAMQEIGFWFINDVIWHKKNPTPNFKGTRLNNSHETLIWAVKSQKSKFTFNYKTAKELNRDNVSQEEFLMGVRKQMGSVWRIAVCSGNERLRDENGQKLHSTQKPEELLYRIINISSKPNDLILDPFGGTFTTGAVAKQCGRSFIGIDMDEKYCDAGRKRIEEKMTLMGGVENAEYDKKPVKVSLKEMIDGGYLQAGEKLFIKQSPLNVVLLEDGYVKMPDNQITNIHVAAAKITDKKAERVNGFDYWTVERNNQRVSIDLLRENYRQSIQK